YSLHLITTPTDNHPLSLHDALPILLMAYTHALAQATDCRLIFGGVVVVRGLFAGAQARRPGAPSVGIGPRFESPRIVHAARAGKDRKSTRLNSSHVQISYAVFCLKQ